MSMICSPFDLKDSALGTWKKDSTSCRGSRTGIAKELLQGSRGWAQASKTYLTQRSLQHFAKEFLLLRRQFSALRC